MTRDEIADFADRFFAATFAGDVAALRALYAPDAVFWHNTDRREIGVGENLEIVRKFASVVPDQRCTVVRREILPDGFLQQDMLAGTLPDGSPFSQTSCVIVRLDHGRVKRVDEYIDSREVEPVSRFWAVALDRAEERAD